MARNKKKASREKKTLKERLAFGDVEIPRCIHARTQRMYMLAVGILLVGVAFAFISFDLYVTIGSVILAAITAAIAYYGEYSMSHHGYAVLEGLCNRVEYTVTSQIKNTASFGKAKEVPSRFIIETEIGLVGIPYFRQYQLLSEGDSVIVYLKNDSNFIEIRGILTPETVLGYEQTF